MPPCNNCREREDGKHGLCDVCLEARRERVWESIRSREDQSSTSPQSTLGDW